MEAGLAISSSSSFGLHVYNKHVAFKAIHLLYKILRKTLQMLICYIARMMNSYDLAWIRFSALLFLWYCICFNWSIGNCDDFGQMTKVQFNLHFTYEFTLGEDIFLLHSNQQAMVCACPENGHWKSRTSHTLPSWFLHDVQSIVYHKSRDNFRLCWELEGGWRELCEWAWSCVQACSSTDKPLINVMDYMTIE